MGLLAPSQNSKQAFVFRCTVASTISVLFLVIIYFYSGDVQHMRPWDYVTQSGQRPASKLPTIDTTHSLPTEDMAIQDDSASYLVCGGIDIEKMLHVNAGKKIDPDMDVFLNNSHNYPQLGLAPSTWVEAGMRERWFHLNGVSLWRPLSKTYWTVNRIAYTESGTRSIPKISYFWWEEWTEGATRRIGSGEIPINIPQIEDETWGPEDPRIFEDPYGNICFLFTMLDASRLHKLWLYNVTTEEQIALHTPADWEAPKYEKNWTPFIHDNKIKLVYAVEPLCVIACDFSDGACEIEYTADRDNPSPSEFHGGTNWLRWKDSAYYLSFAHTTVEGHPITTLRPSLTVMSTHNNSFRIAYASGPLDLRNLTFVEPFGSGSSTDEMDASTNLGRRVLVSSSITRSDLLDQNSLLMTVSSADDTTDLLEIRGISDAMEAIIKRDAGFWDKGDDGEKAADCAIRTATLHKKDMFRLNDPANLDRII